MYTKNAQRIKLSVETYVAAEAKSAPNVFSQTLGTVQRFKHGLVDQARQVCPNSFQMSTV